MNLKINTSFVIVQMLGVIFNDLLTPKSLPISELTKYTAVEKYIHNSTTEHVSVDIVHEFSLSL